jgi:hypothetical protein
MSKLLAFGDSFTFGNDLSDWNDCKPSQLTWPALISKHYNLEYECHANPGIGNLRILESILQTNIDNSFCIINWSWVDRFDFCSSNTEKWETIRPTAEHSLASYYYKNFHGQYQDILSTLIYIDTAINYLLSRNNKFIMTIIDDLVFENIMPTWHNPTAVEQLQTSIKPHIKYFNGLTFLEWAKGNNFPISNRWHPLEEAHQAAFEYIKNETVM